MNIGYDAKRLFNNFTGLGNYSRDLVAGMTTHYPANNYFLYTPHIDCRLQAEIALRLPPSSFSLRQAKGFVYKQLPSLWRSYGIVNDIHHDEIDLYHGLSHELPIGIDKAGIKTVVTIHDLIFYLYPHLFPFIDRQIYYQKFSHACRVADRIIAISECTKRDIVKIFNTDPNKIDVVYQSCNAQFAIHQLLPPSTTNDSSSSHVSSSCLPPHYILSVGSIEERKNLLLTVKALKEIDPSISLVVVGRRTSYFNQVAQYIKDNNLTNRIHFLVNVSLADLPSLYQHALAFIYPSRYEGFGIPIIEALTSGTPVIAATGSCLEEAGGTGSIYVHPDDSHALASAISLINSSPSQRQQMILSGFNHIKQFSPSIISQNVMNTYHKTLNI